MNFHTALRIATAILLCCHTGEAVAVPVPCINPGPRTDNEGVITSSPDPSIPTEYAASQDCTWEIPKKVGYKIKLTVDTFELTKRERDVCLDTVRIQNVDFCGDHESGFEFEGPYLNGVTIKFITDSTYEAKGFTIKYIQELIPTCDMECENNGECVAHNKCSCTENYVGAGCSYKIVSDDEVQIKFEYPEKRNYQSCSAFGFGNYRTFDGAYLIQPHWCEMIMFEIEDELKITISMRKGELTGLPGLINTVKIKRGVQTIMVTDTDDGKYEKKVVKRGGKITEKSFYGPYSISKPYDRIQIVVDELVTVQIAQDGSYVHIMHVKKKENLKGLCGNFNGDQDDDTPNFSPDLFFAELQEDASCKITDVPTPDAENIPQAVYDICRLMYLPIFEQCLTSDIDILQKFCVYDMVSFDFTKHKNVHCGIMTQFVRDCQEANITMDNWTWRKKGRCAVSCPNNQIYNDCAPDCPKTCKSVGTPAHDCKDICMSGCTCPEGLYMEGDTCVEIEECPCHVGNDVYLKGETRKQKNGCEDCVCKSGVLECKVKEGCEATAIVFGNPHFLTFDGLWYTFDGVCQYSLLEKENDLNIMIKQVPCGTENKFTCIDYVKISSETFNDIILENDGTVKHGGASLPSHFDDKFMKVRKTTSTFNTVTLLEHNIKITWTKDFFKITVKDDLKDTFKGLLGNFNGITDDELQAPTGMTQATVNAFGKSWITNPSTCTGTPTTGELGCVLPSEDEFKCEDAIERTAFAACLAATNSRKSMLPFCKDSICAANGQIEKDQSVCTVLSVMATVCAGYDYIVDWRSSSFCNMDCTNKKIYKPWINSCDRTCQGISESENCEDDQMAEGCVCPEGLYEDQYGDCVLITSCQCFHDGVWRENDRMFEHDEMACFCKNGVVTCAGTDTNCTANGMVFSRCSTKDCERTCENKKRVCGNDCKPGCACPEGQFYENGTCIPAEQCQCKVNDEYLQNGESRLIVETCEQCVCINGDWTCEHTTLCSRVCSVTNGRQYQTFDAERFSSSGTCNYRLVTDNCPNNTDSTSYVDIQVKSHSCGYGTIGDCRVTMSARIGDRIYTLTKGNEPQIEYLGFDVKFADILHFVAKFGNTYVVEADFPDYFIQLAYDTWEPRISIQVSANITSTPNNARKLCGLCGNLDGSSTNDISTPKNPNANVNDFVNYWKVDAETTCPDVTGTEPNMCLGKTDAEEHAKRRCAVITGPLFQSCHNLVDPNSFYRDCVKETCSCDIGVQCECFCTVVSAYANTCARRGAKVNWRYVTGCPVQCEEFTDPAGDLCDVKYDVCRSCVRTCCGRCTRGCFEGCFPSCDEGLYYDVENKTCITPDQCPYACINPPTIVVPTTGTNAWNTTPSGTTGWFTTTTTVTTGTTPWETTPSETTGVSTAITSFSTGATTSVPCGDTQCSFTNVDNVTEKKKIGSTWELGCLKFTCEEDDNGCPYKTHKNIVCSDNTICKDYEAKVNKQTTGCCPEYECECDECIFEGSSYPKESNFTDDSTCVHYTCSASCPEATQYLDERNECPAEPDCEMYHSVTKTNSDDPCCDAFSCSCNKSSCPAEPTCVDGMKTIDDKSNDCCTFYECLPTCLYNGKQYANGSVVSSTACTTEYCECDNDSCGVWKNDNQVCPPSPECINDDTRHYPSTYTTSDKCCETHQCKCECKVYGDPHYTTFDGKHYLFQGLCQYVLVTYRDTDNLQIIGENEECVRDMKGLSCLKSVTVIWKGTTIQFAKDNTIFVNGKPLESSLPKSIGGIHLRKRPNNILRLQIFEIQLQLDFKGKIQEPRVTITAPMSQWFNKTVGLCGTCSNDRDDDFETSQKNKTTVADDFATSWEYNSTEGNCLPCNPPTDRSCWNCSDPRFGSDLPPYCKPCDNPCEFLNHEIFDSCTINKDSYYTSCVLDAEAQNKCDLCESAAIQDYADSCECVEWRTAANCTSTCPDGQIFRECVSTCELMRTCSDRHIQECQEMEKGCGCPEGYILKDSESNECIEEKCCDCSDPVCKDYEDLVLNEGEDPDDCCAKKSCKCKSVQILDCISPYVLNMTDNGTPGCFRNECICPSECPAITIDCNNTLGCQKKMKKDLCECPISEECECDTSKCSQKTECPKCHTSTFVDSNMVSGGCSSACCQEQVCEEVKCSPPSNKNIPEYPTEKCHFLKRKASFATDDTEECCPTEYNIECLTDACDNIPVKECQPGYVLTTVSVENSENATIRSLASCPMVDICCPHKVCICNSCPLQDGSTLDLGGVKYTDSGCQKNTCTSTDTTDDGCYESRVDKPQCPDEPECECYQNLSTTPPPKMASSDSEWADLCCTKYECVNTMCGADYNEGPKTCPFPQKRVQTFEQSSPNCDNKNCPVYKCECDLCVDSSNNTHTIGTVYSKGDHCENFTCTQDEDRICPQILTLREPCNPINCNPKYYELKSKQVDGECCPVESCVCKPHVMLEENCTNWKSDDPSQCPDADHMTVEIIDGKYQDSECCPEKHCVCKGNDTINCEKWTDYKCPSIHQMRTQTKSISKTNCCPDFECQCDCAKVKCEYDSWETTNDEECSCKCTCNSSLCNPPLKCKSYEDQVENGTIDDGCCSDWECICNEEKCPELAPITCNEYQEEYLYYASPDDCCPIERKCRCISDHGSLTELCKKNNAEGSLPHSCDEGWEPFITNVSANYDASICCDVQCRCTVCRTSNNETKHAGSTWSETIDCKKHQNTCSDKKLTNGCNKIETVITVEPCESLTEYETRECNANEYAVNLPQTGCCGNYNCESCSTTNRTCTTIFQTITKNETHERCPGKCECVEPLTTDLLDFCKIKANCPDMMEATLGNDGSNVHDEACCPNYNCSCKECPLQLIRKEDLLVLVNKDACEKIMVKKSDEDKECCQGYEIVCDDDCACENTESNCNTTIGCSTKKTINDCGCTIDATCECDPDNCPTKTCDPCMEVIRTKPVPDPAASCSGICCDVFSCQPVTCPTEKPLICGPYQKAYPSVSDEQCCPPDRCTCIKDMTDLAEACGGIDTTCSDGYTRTYKDNDTQCCPTCSCDVCKDDDGNNHIPGSSWQEKDGNCKITKYCTANRGLDGCFSINTTYSEEEHCTKKETYEEHCDETEEAVEIEALYSCCPDYDCTCSRNETLLREKCDEYDGKDCSKYKTLSSAVWINCCPLRKCDCKECKYECPEGTEPKLTNEKDPNTDDCCNKYSCECKECNVDGGPPLLVDDSLSVQVWPGCNFTKTCVRKTKTLCEITENDPTELCQTTNEYQKDHCNTPYQAAVSAGEMLENNKCCPKYNCECNNTEMTCPDKTEFQCSFNTQEPVENGVLEGTSDCCKNYLCECKSEVMLSNLCIKPEVCKAGYVIVEISSSVPCCKNYTCKCDPTTCSPPINKTILDYPTPKCPFLKRKASFATDDTEECCPTKYDIECLTDACDNIPVKECQPGYVLTTVSVENSENATIRSLASCPMVDRCCPHKVCTCNSCPLQDGSTLDLGGVKYTDSGCQKNTCTSTDTTDDGCYEARVDKPQCPDEPECECYQNLSTTPPPKMASSDSEWADLCCTKYECVNTTSCSADYNEGPKTCPFPQKRAQTFEQSSPNCDNKNCPVYKCECDLCVDSSNNTHTIGTVYSKGDHCENFTCTQDEDRICPQILTLREPCNPINCNPKYYELKSKQVDGECCPVESCVCKPHVMLEENCTNWKSDDPSQCPDADHMTVEIIDGKYQDSECCPEKHCVCKGNDTINCEKWTDYKCPSIHQMRTQTKSISKTNCCPDFECQCDCAKVKCEYDSWETTNDEECSCKCTCNSSLCNPPLKCKSYEDQVENGTIDDGCCSDWECICNEEKCPELAPITCNEYQEEYLYYASPDDCCPIERKCRCISDHGSLTELCKKNNAEGSLPHSCDEGWEPFITNVSANYDASICCDVQCRCTVCRTSNNETKHAGSTWSETIDCQKHQNTCSDKKLTNGCNKIETVITVEPCESLTEYETRECNANEYAVNLPQTGCCGNYNCESCSTTNRTCTTIFQTITKNETHERCPGKCECVEPLTTDLLDFCKIKANCPDMMEATLGNDGSNVHDEACCPNYNCSCKECPLQLIRKEDLLVLVNKDACEKIMVKKSDEDKECCQGYEIVCDDDCACENTESNCNTTIGCSTKKTINDCGCTIDATCECDPDNCPTKTCDPCMEVIRTKPVPDPAASCSGICCDVFSCQPVTCPTEKPLICGPYQKAYPSVSDEQCCPPDRCTCIKDMTDLAEACGGIDTTCSDGYTRTYKDNDTQCCPTCSCDVCKDDDGNNHIPGSSWQEKDGNCKITKYCTANRGLDGCFSINTTYSEEEHCTKKETYEEHCDETEEAVEIEALYSCCPDYDCTCSRNETLLREKCDEYDGKDCSKYKTLSSAVWINCCPLRKCDCKECKYECPEGTEPKLTNEKDPNTDDCCNKYSCECKECNVDGGPPLLVDDSLSVQVWPGCNFTKTCVRKTKTLCEITENDPTELCQTTNEYQKDHCNTPYQAAVSAGEMLENNKCCPKYNCECNNTEMTCPDKTEFQCSFNTQEPVENGVLEGTSDCCKNYLCECKSEVMLSNLCIKPEVCKAGYVIVEISSSVPCCKNYTCKCDPTTCSPPINKTILDYPTPKCPFLKRKASFATDDTEECCPTKYDIECLTDACDNIPVKECQPGYVLTTVSVENSENATIRSLASCPMVDRCCPHKVCTCNSCPLQDGSTLDLGGVKYTDSGCQKNTCTSTDTTDDGCYEARVDKPQCPDEPECECYQNLSTTPPPKMASSDSEWADLCCTKYECVNTTSCSADYNEGPKTCPFPQKRAQTFEQSSPNCDNKNCPVYKCECDLCVDSSNNTHTIGTVYSKGDHCENFTCTQDEDRICPQILTLREPCNPINCNPKYYELKSKQVDGECCPVESCVCKPHVMLEENCTNWKSDDPSQCPDADHMTVEIIDGKYQDSECCPEKHCVCKGNDTINCEKWTDYKCSSIHQMRTQTKSISKTNCCPDFECQCDCAKVKCEYDSWETTNDEECSCKCTCNSSLCNPPLKCKSYEDQVENGTIDDGCCSDWECICNEEKCPELAPITCNEYQEEYLYYASPDDCCPIERKCRCISDHGSLTELCKKNNAEGSLPHSCDEGWEPFISNVSANYDASICCDVQCRCTVCRTSNNETKQAGSTWSETIDCKKHQNTCSDKKLTNGCNKIETVITVEPCESLTEYETRECNANEYAVNLPQTGCCGNYNCESCSTTNRTCTTIFQTITKNETHERCPGKCECVEPLTTDLLDFCKIKANCPDMMEATLGNDGSNVHDEACCPNYNCSCKECPLQLIRKEDLLVLVNKDACEKIMVKKSDEDKECCQGYEIVCDDDCACENTESNCNTTIGCSTKKTINDCGCTIDATCECDPDNCPTKTCDPCMKVIRTKPVPDPAAPCSGICCDVLSCQPVTCPTEKPPICGPYQKAYPSVSDECCPPDRCTCIKDMTDLAEACGGIDTTCSDGYTRTYKDNDTQCCPTCSCDVCKDDDGNNHIPGSSWQEKDGNCEITKSCTANRGLDGCFSINTTYSEEEHCTKKETYEEYCDETEEAVEIEALYSCCPDYDCQCSINTTLLREKCDEYDGKDCGKYKTRSLAGMFNCCPQWKCTCDKCEYECPEGTEPKFTNEKDPNTDDCCNKYSCECKECNVDGGPPLLVDDSLSVQVWPGCNFTKTCVRKTKTLCEITENDPTELCQTTNEYQKDHCNTPYQAAVSAGEMLENNKCCPKYNCECNSTEMTCPDKTEFHCSFNTQKPVENGVLEGTSDCCKNYSCECKSEVMLSDLCIEPEVCKTGFSKKEVPSSDPCCKNYTCICDPTTCENYNNMKCSKGNKVVLKNKDQCCPDYDCVCESCVIGGLVHEVNTSWREGCWTLTCSPPSVGETCPNITSEYTHTCDPIDVDDCKARGGVVREVENTDGCCKECTLCKRSVRKLNLTKTFNGEECHSVDAVDVGQCEGACPTKVEVDWKTGHSNAVCTCCEPTVVTQDIMMICGEKLSAVPVSVSESCKCTND